jgi:hypothetical protein
MIALAALGQTIDQRLSFSVVWEHLRTEGGEHIEPNQKADFLNVLSRAIVCNTSRIVHTKTTVGHIKDW